MSESELRNADIDTALTEAKEAYVTRNPKSFARFVEATAVMPGGNTRTVLHYAPFPIGIARGEGCRLWDLDGAEYVDFLGEYTAGIYGHSHPAIRAAVDRALDGGINFGGTNLTEAKFARAVCDRFGLERVRFTNSGTEANLLAISRRPHLHQALQGHGVRRRLPRRGVRLRRRRLADQRAVRLRDGAIQRHRRDAGADRAARGRPGTGDPGADDGRRRLHRRGAGVPHDAARGDQPRSARC